jgi:hypothetical protein
MPNKQRNKKGKCLFEAGKEILRPIGVLVLVGSFGFHSWEEAKVGFPEKHIHPYFNITDTQMMTTSIMTSAGTTTSMITSAGIATTTYLKF